MSEFAALLTSAESKFAGFLKEHKIDPQRVLIASEHVEKLRPVDRAIRLGKRQARGKEDEAAKAARAKKPRSGRPVTENLLRAAIGGSAVTGPQKSRLLRAVAHLAGQKKLGDVALTNLF